MKRAPITGWSGFYSLRRTLLPQVRAAISSPELHYDQVGCWDVDFPDRLVASISQRGGFEEVSRLTSISVPVLKRYCYGGQFPSLRNCALIALACDVSLDWLMDMKTHRRSAAFQRKLKRLLPALTKKQAPTSLREGDWIALGFIAICAVIWLQSLWRIFR